MEDKDMELQFITHFTDTYSYYDSARMALEGGCRWIQLRMKDTPADRVEQEAIRLQRLCKDYGATFIIDDHVHLAKKIHADGVHLGKQDMPVAEARNILGQGFIIGGTANTFDDVKMHHEAGADYIGCGPFRFTTTKKNLSPVLGLEGYRTIVRQMKEAGIRLPIVAIGGITYEDIPAIMETGVTGIALSGTILRATNPVAETGRILSIGKEDTPASTPANSRPHADRRSKDKQQEQTK
ncbi:MAG: thiamine phosphate synthase [Phocaeicola sp.]|nr:thiamine phosphate synthase [Phocaeicola sp.]